METSIGQGVRLRMLFRVGNLNNYISFNDLVFNPRPNKNEPIGKLPIKQNSLSIERSIFYQEGYSFWLLSQKCARKLSCKLFSRKLREEMPKMPKVPNPPQRRRTRIVGRACSTINLISSWQ